MRLLLLKNTYLEVERPSGKLLGERGVQTARSDQTDTVVRPLSGKELYSFTEILDRTDRTQ